MLSTVNNNIIVNQPDELLVSLQLDPVVCNGGTTGQATATVTGGNGGYVYSWASIPSNNTPVNSGLSAGTYSLSVTDANGCSVTEVFNINQPVPLSINATINNVSCSGNSDGTATVGATGGTGPYNYLWSDGQTTAHATGLSAGTYTCTVTDANGCSPASATIPVTLVDPPSINVSVFPVPVSCNGGATGSISISVSGGTQFSLPSEPYHYLWSNSTTTSTNSSLIAGTYNCQITDANGCVANTGAIVITEPSTSLSASVLI